MNIYLIGFMGCGKSSVGMALAQSLGCDFVDTDHLIEMQQGVSISAIFAAQGEAAFREMERRTLTEVQTFKNAIVSTGGGLPCYNDCMDVMLAGGCVVYLKTSPQELSRRLICSKTVRPLLRDKTQEKLHQYITEELRRREFFYGRAHAIIQTDGTQVDELVRAIQKKMQCGENWMS